MKKILILITFIFCTNFVYSQTTIESYFGKNIDEIESLFFDSTFQSQKHLNGQNNIEVLSTKESQSMKFLFDNSGKCVTVVYATNIHEIARSLIEDNDLTCGESIYVKDTNSSAIQWLCKEKFIITLKVYTEGEYPFQFTYSLK